MRRILFFTLMVLSLQGFAKNDPIWMQLERGKNFYEQRDYGNAMICFRKALAIENITATSLPERLTKEDVEKIIEEIIHETELTFFQSTLIEEEYFYRVKTTLSEFDRIRLANLFQEYQHQPKLPEAYVMMARILEIEGEFPLAERHYKNALIQAKDFHDDSMIYEIYYRLIELYIRTDNKSELEKAFAELNSYNRFLNSKEGQKFVEDIYLCFKKNGLEKTLELYRREGDSFLYSYRLAGDRYVETGDHESAVKLYLLHALVSMSVLLKEVDSFTYGNSVVSSEKLFEEALRNDYMVRYIKAVDLFGTFYKLGSALYSMEDWSNAQTFFWLVAQFSPEIEIKDKAASRWNEIATEKIN